MYDKKRLQNTDIADRAFRKLLTNQNLTVIVLNTFLNINNVKEQTYIKMSPKYCNTKQLNTK